MDINKAPIVCRTCHRGFLTYPDFTSHIEMGTPCAIQAFAQPDDEWTLWEAPEVPSSQVKETRYNASLMAMEVRFASGAVYRYANVPPSLYEALHTAKSAGKFLNETFKVNAAKYPATKQDV